MAFPPSFLDDIRMRVSLSGLVGRRVQLKQRARGDYWGLSPFANEKTPSFHVREDKGYFHCFATGEHGDHFTWLMKTEGLAFMEAVEFLAGEAGLAMPERTPEQREQDQRRGGLLETVEEACSYFQRALRTPEGADALAYLRSRGLQDETIARFRLGYAPMKGDALLGALGGVPGTKENLLEAGLLRNSRQGSPYGFFRDRIMFPITDKRGAVIAFGGRYMGDAKADGVGKYINSPDTPLFDKGRSLYNHPAARQAAYDGAPLLVVEGYMDVIALAEHGVEGAVAPLGTAITETQIAELWRMADEPVLCLDGDTAGRGAAMRAAERALPSLSPGKSLGFAFLPAGEDPDSLVRSQGPSAIVHLVDRATPLVEALWKREAASARLDTPERKAALEKSLFALTGRIENETVRRLYQQSFRDKLWQAFREASRKSKGSLAGISNFGPRRTGQARSFGPQRGEQGAHRGADEALRRRRAEVLMAASINHPDIALDQLESIAKVPLDLDLESLRSALATVLEAGPSQSDEMADLAPTSLEAPSNGQWVRTALAALGFEGVVTALQRPKLLEFAHQAREGAEPEEARALIDALLREFEQEALYQEVLRAAPSQEVDLKDPSYEKRLLAFRDSYRQGEDAMIDNDDF